MENLHAKIDGEEIPIERMDGGPSDDADQRDGAPRAENPPARLDPDSTRRAFFWGAAATVGAAGLGLLVRAVWNRVGDRSPTTESKGAKRVKRKRKKKKKKRHEPT